MNEFVTVDVPTTKAAIREMLGPVIGEAEAILSSGATGPLADASRRALLMCACIAGVLELKSEKKTVADSGTDTQSGT